MNKYKIEEFNPVDGYFALISNDRDSLIAKAYSLQGARRIVEALIAFDKASLAAPEPKMEERDSAWDKCRADREPVTGSDDWTVGEVGDYRGFFNLGWEAAFAQRKEGA